MLPKDASGLPAWRERVMPWIMAAVRFAAGWILARGPLVLLLGESSFLRPMATALERDTVAVAYVLGVALFTWPATYLAGYGLLLVALAAFEWLWHRIGFHGSALPLFSAAILSVLALGEWFSRWVRRRLYSH
ncbi:MAG: hypothetical protein WCH32_00110 [Pseudomonadota bacterium]|nr:hypothetical protein [Pseudomonadota bacterium]